MYFKKTYPKRTLKSKIDKIWLCWHDIFTLTSTTFGEVITTYFALLHQWLNLDLKLLKDSSVTHSKWQGQMRNNWSWTNNPYNFGRAAWCNSDHICLPLWRSASQIPPCEKIFIFCSNLLFISACDEVQNYFRKSNAFFKNVLALKRIKEFQVVPSSVFRIK